MFSSVLDKMIRWVDGDKAVLMGFFMTPVCALVALYAAEKAKTSNIEKIQNRTKFLFVNFAMKLS